MAKSNTAEFMEALTLLAKEKGMSPEVLIEKIETALTIAIKKDYPRSENINYDIDVAKNKFDVAIMKTVVEEVEDPANEILLSDAREISKRLNVGDMCPIKLDTKHFGRIAAQTAKQVIKQGIKEVEREQLVEQWGGLQNEAVSAEVKKVETDSLNALVSVNGTEVMLFRGDQIPGETLREGDVVKVFVSGVSSADRRPTLRVSRTHRDLIKRLFELEVPEIADGTVEIKSVSREAGSRSKIAVISSNENVDPLGACIGPQRSRITKICDELCGEKIDVVKYSEDHAEFIKQALKPANVISVDIPDPEIKSCSVVVPDNQLSLAIGNKGQNAKLAARLTGFKIDIKPESGFFEGN
ncbi:MAG: transcription termination/antitermination protein NusA [Ruminiclostridium sp.]|nr:transcription termination/antitermination protein NusA [Ruminiclostridium sp.]